VRETIIDPLLPQEQAGFRHGRSAVDQVTLSTQDIEDSISAKRNKSYAMFLDANVTFHYCFVGQGLFNTVNFLLANLCGMVLGKGSGYKQ